MLVVLEAFRGRGIATQLVRLAIDAMIEQNADEVCLPMVAQDASKLTLVDLPGNRSREQSSNKVV